MIDRRRALEALLADRAAAVLGLLPDRVRAGAPLGSFGLDSLSAAELAAEMEGVLGVSLPFADLLGGAGIAELAERLDAALAGAAPRPEPSPLEPAGGAGDPGEPPLSLGQQALWYLHGLAPESAAYTLAGAARLPAEVDGAALGRALQALVERHDALRATFHPGVDGPVQRSPARMEVAFRRADADGWSAEALRLRLAEEAFRPFDLAEGPLFRAALFTRADAAFLVLAVHHAAADFGSLAVVASELGALYDHFAAGGAAGDLPLPPPALRFADYARWQNRAATGPWGERLWEYWRDRLSGAPPLDLPTDRPRPPAQTFRGAARRARFGPARGLGELARRSGCTPFMALLAGFEIVLARLSGQEDFVVGAPTSGRRADRSAGRLAGLVGYLVNPLPLRADVAGDPTVAELLARVRCTALGAFEHAGFPFALLAERLRPERAAGRSPVFQVMLTLHQAATAELQALAAFALGEPGIRLALGGLHLESLALEPPGAALDLTLMAAEVAGDLAACLQFNTDLFDTTTAERLLGHLGNLLAGMLAEPGRRLSALPLLSAAERAQLAAWNDTAVAWEGGRTFPGLAGLVVEQARRTPGEVAVEGEDGALTYAELEDGARRLAGALRALGVGPESRVGIAARRSPEMVEGLLGILLAGGAYVPLDPDDPPDRLAFLLDDSGVSLLLAERRLLPSLPAPGAATLCLDAGEAWRAAAPLGEAAAGDPDGLAYVIYTSGSTGRPKGAMNTQRGIVNRLLWMQAAFGLGPADRVLHKTSTGFDVSVWELFWPLLAGARLVLARPGGHRDPAYLAERIAAAGVTTVHFVPSLLQAFLDAPRRAAPGALKRVIASGEALSGELTVRFRTRFPSVELHNLYGPTEAAVDVTWWPADGESGERAVPIGRPIANTRIHLLDRYGVEVPCGAVGEIHIGGVQLARGYWRRPDLTAERFVPAALGAEPGARLYRTGDLARRLDDGAVEFLGRLDHQVKLRGVRLELGEVEAALAAGPGVCEAVAGVRGSGAMARLVAWVVPRPGAGIDLPALREALRRRLPELMVPSLIAVLPALPRTPSGKLDRQALPDPEAGAGGASAPYVAPRTPVEEALVGVWQELLGVDRVGIDDHFFDLGGHSLLATRLMARVRHLFSVNLPLSALFEISPTVAGLAQAVARYQVNQADGDDLASALLELEGLSDEEVRALLDSEEA